jgi:peptide/nickel transport system permease protein
MRNYLLKRLLLILPVVLGVATFVFLIIHLVPGDPVDVMLGEMAQPADRAQLREELGLDQPLLKQYAVFLGRAFRGNLGRSLHYRQSVASLIGARLPATLELALASMVVAIAIALPTGILSATRPNSWADHTAMVGALLGVSMPNFWLGPLLIIAFSLKLGWLPVAGREGLAHLVLPAVTLGTALAAILTRMTRSALLEVIQENYIVTARAKGLTERCVIWRHALSNALIPVVTVMGLQFGALLSGSIIVETIFSWPGVGRLTIQAILARDYPLVQGCILVIALGYVLANLLVDCLYSYIDPRIRYGRP